jgi:hypothetical protein
MLMLMKCKYKCGSQTPGVLQGRPAPGAQQEVCLVHSHGVHVAVLDPVDFFGIKENNFHKFV